MKHPEKWKVWPDEVPPENVPLRIETPNERYNILAKTDGLFFEGRFWYTPKGSDSGPSDKLHWDEDMPEKVFWRLWEDEE